MVGLSKSMWSLALQPLKMYLYCPIVYNYQTWKGGDLPRRTVTGKVLLCFCNMILQDHVRN